ncbi:ATP-dependent DNA ligase [Microbacterium sp. M3]|uniref:ATP-dependent DNA ligase n=1 Tax=Microbacterium arthrosphaerae TaxID=792652 RepID=A0ABU4H2W8_9MICO|nr:MULTISPECIES: ATP-dependent DNA ligase [Microbacterium]MDW4573670.1 ATP-dependent DNA ligase [Microbacterium arthrosphaerae]MDW7607525.1 ATP-dependent DNA ligase [Microbacterium sp. M3]
MGKLTYEGTVKVDLDDRTLAHLMVVIGTKLRRGEPFHFSWRDDASIGDGRTAIWVHPRCSLVYKFYGSRLPQLNPAWIDALSCTANSQSGLYVVPEPAAPSSQPHPDHHLVGG